ncbi:MAG: PQQ-binding-like beta-propeller repeat protein [Bacteroidia bacterium]|nr:PQQ-binding-like beta-propeller repeat protein [Bacteroidia bacterium]
MLNSRLIFALLLASLPLKAQNHADRWTGYRGNLDNGYSQAKNVPLHWSDSTNVLWKVPVPGRGWSSPVVLNGQVWLTTATPDGKEFRAIGINCETGKIFKNIMVFEALSTQETHPLNSYASPTPAIEPGRVYVHFGTYGTACLDTESGKVIWQRTDIHCDHLVGPGSSPFLYKDLLILTMDGIDVQYLEGLNKNTGKTVWKKFRGVEFGDITPDCRKAFSTPILTRIDNIDQLISVGPHVVEAYQPLTGELIWKVRYEGFSASARPVIGNGMMFINTGFGQSWVMAIRLGGSGDMTAQSIVWSSKKNLTARSSPLFIDGLLYMVNTAGQAKCLDAMTGAEIWTQRVGLETSASPVYAEGRIYTTDQSGLTTVFAPGRAFKKIAENTLPEGCMASMAVVDGAIYIRTRGHLYRVGK